MPKKRIHTFTPQDEYAAVQLFIEEQEAAIREHRRRPGTTRIVELLALDKGAYRGRGHGTARSILLRHGYYFRSDDPFKSTGRGTWVYNPLEAEKERRKGKTPRIQARIRREGGIQRMNTTSPTPTVHRVDTPPPTDAPDDHDWFQAVALLDNLRGELDKNAERIRELTKERDALSAHLAELHEQHMQLEADRNEWRTRAFKNAANAEKWTQLQQSGKQLFLSRAKELNNASHDPSAHP